MRKITKRVRRLLSVVLACILCLSCSIPAFAAGPETWNYSTSLVPVGSFNCTDTNLTPVKTMGYTGTLTIDISYFERTDAYSSSPVKLTVQARRAGTSTVLAQDVYYEEIGFGGSFSFDVKKGDQIQIFFDVSTAEGYSKPGPYRSAYVRYGYVLR